MLLYDIPYSFNANIGFFFGKYNGVASLTSRQAIFRGDSAVISTFKCHFQLESITYKIFTDEEVDLLVSLCKPGCCRTEIYNFVLPAIGNA